MTTNSYTAIEVEALGGSWTCFGIAWGKVQGGISLLLIFPCSVPVGLGIIATDSFRMAKCIPS